MSMYDFKTLPKLVQSAVVRIANDEPFNSAVAWTWDRSETDDRLAIDTWIVANKHPLGSLPSTRERRFGLLVRELIETAATAA